MAFPTIPTIGAGRIVHTVQANTTATRTFPDLSGLTKNSGDLLIAIVWGYQSTVTNSAFSSWGGSFTEFLDSGTSTTMAVGLAYKFSTGSETGTFTVTQAATITGHAAMMVLSIPAAHASTPPEAGSRADGTGASANPASFDPGGWGAEDTLWIEVAGAGEDATAGSFTALSATAATNYGSVQTTSLSGDVVGGVMGGVAFRQLNAASEDVGTWTVDTSNARNSALVVAVRPAAAAAHSVPINDSFQGTDAVIKTSGKVIADAFQGTDAITRKAVGKTIPDAFQGTDNFTRTVSYQRSVADAFEGVDNVTVAQPILLLIQDSFQGTDILTSKAVGKTVPDTIQGTDAISKRPGKAVADAFQGTDALTRKAVGKLLGDVLLGSDEIVVDFAPGPMVIQTSFPEGTEVHVYLLRNVQWWRELEQMPPDPGIAIATVASNGTLTFDPGLPPDTYSFWGEIEVPDGYLFLSGPTKAKTVARNVTVTIH